MAKTFGNKIRELRESKDISLREFAKKLDQSPAHISDIELGRRYPSSPLLKKIATILDVKVEELDQYDTRPPVEDIKRIIDSDPAWGIALRKVVDKEISAEELMELTKRKPNRDKSK